VNRGSATVSFVPQFARFQCKMHIDRTTLVQRTATERLSI
jgi:hypothetical protein